jgi:hypothetical protein
MTREELNLRILELFPKLAEVEDWDWAETEDDEPVVMVENRAPSPASSTAPSTSPRRSRTRR